MALQLRLQLVDRWGVAQQLDRPPVLVDPLLELSPQPAELLLGVGKRVGGLVAGAAGLGQGGLGLLDRRRLDVGQLADLVAAHRAGVAGRQIAGQVGGGVADAGGLERGGGRLVTRRRVGRRGAQRCDALLVLGDQGTAPIDPFGQVACGGVGIEQPPQLHGVAELVPRGLGPFDHLGSFGLGDAADPRRLGGLAGGGRDRSRLLGHRHRPDSSELAVGVAGLLVETPELVVDGRQLGCRGIEASHHGVDRVDAGSGRGDGVVGGVGQPGQLLVEHGGALVGGLDPPAGGDGHLLVHAEVEQLDQQVLPAGRGVVQQRGERPLG